MDEQGIDKALMFPAAAHDIESEFADRIDALYADIRAFNRWMHEEVGFIAESGMWLPPYISFGDPELDGTRLELVVAQGANVIQTRVRTRARWALQPLRRPLARRSRLRPVLEHLQRGRRAAGGASRWHRLPEVQRRLVRGSRRVSSSSTHSSG